MSTRFTPDDLAAQVAIGQLAISPAGDVVVYSRRRIVEERDRTELWCVPFAGGEPRLLTGARNATTPRFAPDGRTLAYLGEQEDGHGQVVLMPLPGGEPEALTRFPRGVDDVAWAPDGDWLLVASEDERAHGELPARESESATAFVKRRVDWRRNGMADLVAHPVHLHRVDRRSGETSRLTSGPWSVSSPRVAADGSVLFLADTRTDGDILPTPQLHTLSADGTPLALTSLAGSVSAVEVGELGIVVQGREEYREWSPIRPFRLTANRVLEPLAPELDRFVGDSALYSDLFDWHTGTSQADAAVIVAEAGCAIPTRFGSNGPFALVPPAERPLAGSLAVSGDRVAVALTTGLGFAAPDVHAIESGQSRRLTNDGSAWLDGFDLPPVEEITIAGEAGSIPTFLISPPGASDTAPATILIVHGGPSLQWNVVPMLEALILASAGYRVAMPNIRGSIHLGGAPIAETGSFWGDADARDCHTVLDHLIATGQADPSRLGVAGLSYGGFMTSWLVGTSERFAAAVSENGVTNQVAAAGLSEIGVEAITEAGVEDPWAATDILWDRSPLRHVAQIRTPLLLLQAAQDRTCPPGDNEQLFVALRSLRRAVEYVLYPDEGHSYQGAGRFDRRLDRHRRTLAWFERWMPA